MSRRHSPRIVATRHLIVAESLENPRGIRVSRVTLAKPPTTLVCQLQAVMGAWWQRSGAYPVGRDFSTRMG